MQQGSPVSTPHSHRPEHQRAPREWLALRSEPVVLPYAAPHAEPPITSLLIGAASLVGIVVSFFLFSRSGGASMGVGLLAVSGVTALASMATFWWQRHSAARENAELERQFATKLDELTIAQQHDMQGVAHATGKPGIAELAVYADAQARRRNDPPLVTPDRGDPERLTLVPQLLANPGQQWARQPGDPDFLQVRVGVGQMRPRFEVKLDGSHSPAELITHVRHAGIERQRKRAREMVERYALLHDVPVTIPLREHASVAIVTGSSGHDAAGLARSLVGQVVLHHSPREARIVVLATERVAWEWARPLTGGDLALPALIAGNEAAREYDLQRLYGELSRREQLLGDASYGRERSVPLPHLVILVDALLPDEQRLLANPAVELALRRGKELGATVVSLHATLNQAPPQASLAVDLRMSTVTFLWPDPPPPLRCARMDSVEPAECRRIVHAYSRFLAPGSLDQQLPNEVRLLELFAPAIERPGSYDIEGLWQMGKRELADAQASDKPSLTIPIGRGASGQVVLLDLVRDGPHGLLIGQTGSGKSELLRSLITALAMKYSPHEASFVLVDYKGGIELETFAELPHTRTLLTNLDQASQTVRLLAMLESELRERQERRRDGQELSHLFVIIDEFAEMLSSHGSGGSTEVILESLLRILRLGRALNVHLLFASQRPEGSVIGKLRGFVQYRICLRTNTEEDSKDVLGRGDAAHLPVDAPGRGYLLRGDNELQLFQSGRVAITYGRRDAATGEEPKTVDQIVASRMKPFAAAYGLERWPKPLPSPERANPTPLILMLHGGLTPVEDAWNAVPRSVLPKMVVPLGQVDRPAERRREWFEADLFGHAGPLEGGPLLVMGDLNAGKTTTLKTLLLYLAMHATPREVRWYVLDPTRAFRDFESMPHARDHLEPDAVNIVDGFDEQAFRGMKERLQRALAEDTGMGTATGRPPLLLVVDDYDELGARYKAQLHDLAHAVAQGRSKDAYLVISAARQTYEGLPQTLLSVMATKVLLYMSNRDNLSTLLGSRPPFALEPRPGRGFAQTRSTLDEVQIAAPVYGLTEAARAATVQALLRERSAALG